MAVRDSKNPTGPALVHHPPDERLAGRGKSGCPRTR
ncbi:DUF397 domain-containing protein [Streptomyces sp. ISL-98]|nr:DUF397 domain-containing protein [Streptomyces sp. ISL-98]